MTFPARFQLIAAMNPCPCGMVGDNCVCGVREITRYRIRLSGPLLDRIDLQVWMDPVSWEDLAPDGHGRAELPNRPFSGSSRPGCARPHVSGMIVR